MPALLKEAMELRPEFKDRHTLADLLLFAGLASGVQGDLDRSVELHEESLALYRETRNMHGVNMCLSNLGLLALSREDYARATAMLRENLHLARGSDDKIVIQFSLFGLAGVATSQGQPLRAARLWGAAEAVREAAGIHLTPLARSRTNYDGYQAAARAQSEEAAFAQAWEEGRALAQEKAVEYALAEETTAPPPSSGTEGASADMQPPNLTRREREIAVLLARGLTNRQISAELVISERTAGNHVANILRKLGLRSRRQVESWTAEHGLPSSDPE